MPGSPARWRWQRIRMCSPAAANWQPGGVTRPIGISIASAPSGKSVGCTRQKEEFAPTSRNAVSTCAKAARRCARASEVEGGFSGVAPVHRGSYWRYAAGSASCPGEAPPRTNAGLVVCLHRPGIYSAWGPKFCPRRRVLADRTSPGDCVRLSCSRHWHASDSGEAGAANVTLSQSAVWFIGPTFIALQRCSSGP